jgi:hypothetical protein
MQQLKTRGNDALPLLAVDLGLCFMGATYDMETHLHRHILRIYQDPAPSSPIPLGS